MVEKKVVGEGRLPPWEIAQPHPGRRETHHNQGWKLHFLSKSEPTKKSQIFLENNSGLLFPSRSGESELPWGLFWSPSHYL